MGSLGVDSLLGVALRCEVYLCNLALLWRGKSG